MITKIEGPVRRVKHERLKDGPKMIVARQLVGRCRVVLTTLPRAGTGTGHPDPSLSIFRDSYGVSAYLNLSSY